MRTKVALVLACLVLTASPGADDRSFYEGVSLRTNYPNVINILDNGAFVVGYDEARRNPAWAAYRLFANPETFDFDRPSRFSTDARTAARVSHNDYTNSGFSRGHMAPNFAIMTRYGLSAQRATFLMSNVVPQLQALNGGPWEHLERTIARDFANTLEEVWVITGPIYTSTIERLPSGVDVPDRFYKVIIDELNDQPRALAFIMEDDTRRPADLKDFLVSVREVEMAAGFNFFHGLTDATETALESTAATALWTTSGPPPPTIHPMTSALTNVNTAPEEDLELLPGVGPTLAQRIIEGRPYASVDDLSQVNGIGSPTLERLRPLVTVN